MRRLLSALLCAALVFAFGGAGAEISPASPQYCINAVYLEDAQALSVNCSILYTNTTGEALESVEFCVYANSFRRETTLISDNAHLEAAFPWGYAPSGMEISSVCFNGREVSYGFSGSAETLLRVECDLEEGETGCFDLTYTLLLGSNRSFQGCGEDVRLSLFYPSACVYDGGFIANAPSNAGRFLFGESARFTLTLCVPEGMQPGLYGLIAMESADGYVCYSGTFDSANELAFTLGRRYYTQSMTLSTGTAVNIRGSEKRLLSSCSKTAERVLEFLEDLLGPLPYGGVDIVYSDCVLSASYPGLVILGDDADEYSIAAGLIRQYFGCSLITDPATDPFLIEGLGEYLALLCLNGTEEERTEALTERIWPCLRLTIPGSLTPDSYLTRFTTVSDYDTVVRKRGAAVLHEMAAAMGTQTFLQAVAAYYESGAGRINTIEDFVAALDTASGSSRGSALVSWLYTIDEYANLQNEIYD